MPRFFLFRSQGGSSTTMETTKTAIAPTGTLMKKIQRQLASSVM